MIQFTNRPTNIKLDQKENTHQPLVSIIIPCYNSHEYVTETIKSVFQQTYTNYEIIVVDDGSDRPVKDIIDAFQSPKIRYYFRERLGVGATRNYAIQISAGEYIAFLDSDDIWLPEKLELQMAEINKTGCKWAASGSLRFDQSTKKILRYRVQDQHSGYVFNEILVDNFICQSSVIVKKSILHEIGMIDESLKVMVDWDLWLRIAPKYPLANVPMMLVKNRVHPMNITSSTGISHRVITREKILQKTKDQNPSIAPNLITKLTQRSYRAACIQYIKKDEFTKAKEYLKKLEIDLLDMQIMIFRLILLFSDQKVLKGIRKLRSHLKK